MHLPTIQLQFLIYSPQNEATIIEQACKNLLHTSGMPQQWMFDYHIVHDDDDYRQALGRSSDSHDTSTATSVPSQPLWDVIIFVCQNQTDWHNFQASYEAIHPQWQYLILYNPDFLSAEDIITYTRCDYLPLPISARLLEHRLTQMVTSLGNLLMQERYEGVIQYNSDPVIMTDKAGKIILWNHAAEQLYGWQADEVLQRTFAEVVSSNLLEEQYATILQEIDEKGIWQGETIQNNRAGTPLTIISSIFKILNAQNNTLGYLAVNRDVTIQRTVEETLINYRKRIESVLEIMPELVLIFDDEGRYIDVITRNHASLLAPVTDILGKTVHDFFTSEVATQMVNQIKSAIIHNRTEYIDYKIKPGAKPKLFHATIIPLDSNQVLFVAADVTELRYTEEALSEASQRYEALFRFANDAIFLIELKTGDIVEANRQATRLLGYTTAELRTKNITDIEANVDELATSNDLNISVQTGDRIILEQFYRHKDGEIIPVETSNRIILQDERRIIVSFVRDIRQRKDALRAERTQRILAETLRDTATAISRTLDIEQLLDIILDHAYMLIGKRPVNVMLIEDKMARIVRHRGYQRYMPDEQLESLRFDVERALSINHMLRSKSTSSIPDTTAQKDWIHIKGLEWIKSQASVPIIVQNEVVGIINIDSNKTNDFDSHDRDRIQALAEQAAIALQNARLLEGARQHAEELETAVKNRTRDLSNANNALKRQIIERQRIKDQLQQERNLLKTLIDSIPDWIYVHDRNGEFMLINDATRQVLGAEKFSDVVGKPNTLVGTDNAMSPVAHYDAMIFENGLPVLNKSMHFVNADGDEERYLVSKFPLRDSQDEIIGIVGINRNVTSLYRTQEQLEQVLNSARCLLWSAIVEEVDGQYQWQLVVNNEDAAQKLLPLDVSEKSYSQAWQESILLEDFQRRQYLFRTSIQQNRLAYNQEFRCRRADGELVWLIEDVQVKSLPDGRWSLVGVCTDISNLKFAEKALQQANNELEKRVRQRTEELTRANDILSVEIIERQKAEEAERQQRILAEALRDSGALMIDNLDHDRVLDYLLDSLIDVISHDAANISLLTDDLMFVVKQRGYPSPVTTEPIQVAGWEDIQMIKQTRSYFVIHNRDEFEWVGLHGDDWVKSNLTIPILIDDEVVGLLKLESQYPNNFNEKQAVWLQAFANQAGIAMRNARLVDEIRSYTEELEERVRERTAELDNERAQLQAILDSMRDGVFYRDSHDELLYTNKALIDITGYNVELWRNRSVFDQINTSTPEEYERSMTIVDHHMKQLGFWRSDSTLRQQNGQTIDVNLTRTVVKDSSGEPVGVVTVVRDISHEKALEEQKARFIASASHELRTPIANLKTRLFLMTRRPDKFEEHITIANEVVNWMQRLVEDMFDLSRFERGVIELEFENVHLQKFINETVIFQQPEAERKLISLLTEMPSEPIYFRLDPYRMTQVITNLVTNAIHYTPENSEVRIDVDLDEEAGVIIIVSDNGPGIDIEHLPHLFQPFYRGNMGGKGAGLGLSISREIVESHQGTIHVESTRDVGSKFIIHLPRLSDEHIKGQGTDSPKQ